MRPLRARAGLTLVELMVSIVVLGLVMAGTMNFFVGQSRTFRRASSDQTALQNLRFGADLLHQHFRATGAGLTVGQPPIIYGDVDVFAFNADYVTTDTGLVLTGIFHVPNAPANTVRALPAAAAITIPGSGYRYPQVDFTTGDSLGIMSPAEMIVFFFRPDTETVRADDFVLYRQVNDAHPEAVVRNVLADTVPFFQYLFIDRHAASGQEVLAPVPPDSLPLAYTSSELLADRRERIRAVRVSFRVTNDLAGAAERIRPMSVLAPLPNMGKRPLEHCGSEPLDVAPPTVTLVPGARPSVRVRWPAAVDELGGERDVLRYVLWRREVGASEWGDPYASIPAGAPPYAFADANVRAGASYQYAVAAQDCTPSFSNPVASGAIQVP